MLFVTCFTAALWIGLSAEQISKFSVDPDLGVQVLHWHCAKDHQQAAQPRRAIWLFTLETQR